MSIFWRRCIAAGWGRSRARLVECDVVMVPSVLLVGTDTFVFQMAMLTRGTERERMARIDGIALALAIISCDMMQLLQLITFIIYQVPLNPLAALRLRLMFLHERFERGQVARTSVFLQVVRITIHEKWYVTHVFLRAQGCASAWLTVDILALSTRDQHVVFRVVGRHQFLPSRMQSSAMWSPIRVHVQEHPFALGLGVELLLCEFIVRISNSHPKKARQ